MDKISQYSLLRTIWLLEERNYSYKAVFILCQPVTNRVGHSTAPGRTAACNERDDDGCRQTGGEEDQLCVNINTARRRLGRVLFVCFSLIPL